jgi:oligoribonuclease NrnB/cAMP/cGMP phosphodiesterase (DHH superfamily)
MKPLVLYHAGCYDGFCAAWVAKRSLGDADFIPVNYGQDPPDVKGRNVYILDFSYKRPILLQMADAAFNILVIDHHKTASEELSGGVSCLDFPSVLYRSLAKNLTVMFDLSKSGGLLTWEYFCGTHNPPPWIVLYTQDRDLWNWKLPDSREINAALRSYPMDFELWDSWLGWVGQERGDKLLSHLKEEGTAILRREQQIVDQHVQFARELEMDGHLILSVNATVLTSEIAGKLSKGRPFGACYFVRKDGKKVWSLRSQPDGVDVSEVAKKHGGGGHKHASGFEE